MSEGKGQSERISDIEKAVERMATDFRLLRKQVQCSHKWGYHHVYAAEYLGGTVFTYRCIRCEGELMKTWDDLSDEEIAALKVLGIWRRTKKDFADMPLTVADIAALVEAARKTV